MLASSFIERLSAAGPALLPVLVDGAAKGLAVLGVTALAARAMRRASAASRHLVWFLGAISLLALPILSLALPEWRVLPAWAATQAVVVSPPVVQTPVEIQKTTAQEMPVVPAKENYSNEWENSGAKPQAATITQAPAQAVTTPRAIAPVRRTLHVTWQAWVLMGWLAGTGLMLGYIALGLLSLWWLQRRSARITQGPASDLLRELSARLGLRSGILLLSSPRRTMPMTWGLRRTRILLPADADEWSPDQLRAVLLHELAHVRRHDCLTQLLVQFALAAYWFNPLLWLAWRRMQTEREQACDDLVLSTGAKPSAYAEQLLHIAAEMPATRFSAAAIAMARPSKLEGRLLAILDVRRNRRRLTGIALLAAAALGLCIVLPLAMLRGQTKPPANSQGRAQSVSVVAKPPAGFGKVVDVNGHPVAGAKLQSVETTWSAQSDADGLFKLPEIQNGKPERMNLTAPDFVERENVDLWRNSAGSMPNDGIFELHRFGRVEGKILGPDGQPLAGASYLVNTQQKYQSDSLMTANAFSGVTNAQGRFVIEKVTPGDLLLCYPSEEPNTSTPIKGIKSVIPLTLHDGEILRDVMLDLSKSIAAAEGRVVDKEGKPLRGAKVFLCWKTSAATSGAEMDPVFTGADGRYRLEKLPQGPWHLMASIDEASSDSVAVQLSEKPASVPDFVLPVVQTASGRIRRVQPMDAEQTVREWIDATLAKDTQGVAAVVEADSPISRHGDRISLLLVQIKRFPEGSYWSDNEIEKATEKTNELDLGGGRKVQIKFLLAKQSGQWRIFDVVDDKGTSLVADAATTQDSGARSDDWMCGIWIYQRMDKHGPDEPNYILIQLGENRAWIKASLWGTPQQPGKISIDSKGDNWELKPVAHPLWAPVADTSSSVTLTGPVQLHPQVFSLTFPTGDNRFIDLEGEEMVRQGDDSIVFYNFTGDLFLKTEYRRASAQELKALNPSLQKVLGAALANSGSAHDPPATQTSVQLAAPLAAIVKQFDAYPDLVCVQEVSVNHLVATDIQLKKSLQIVEPSNAAQISADLSNRGSKKFLQVDFCIELWAVRGTVDDALGLKGALHPADKPWGVTWVIIYPYGREDRHIFYLGREGDLRWYGYITTNDFAIFERAHPMHGEDVIAALIRGQSSMLAQEGAAALPQLEQAIANKLPDPLFVSVMSQSNDPQVVQWLIRLTASPDKEIARGAKYGLVIAPHPEAAELYVRWLEEDAAKLANVPNYELQLLEICGKYKIKEAASLLPKILAAPHDIREYCAALELSHELAGKPAMPEEILAADKTIRELSWSGAENWNAPKLRQAIDAIVANADTQSAVAVGFQMAYEVAKTSKGYSLLRENAGREILRRLPREVVIRLAHALVQGNPAGLEGQRMQAILKEWEAAPPATQGAAQLVEPPGGRLVDDPVEAVKKVLPEGMVVKRVVRGTYPSYLEEGKGLGIFIGPMPAQEAKPESKIELQLDEGWGVFIMPPDYQGRQQISPMPPGPQQPAARLAASTPQARIFVESGDSELVRKIIDALIVQVSASATMSVVPATQPAQAESWGWLRTEFQEMSIEPKPILLQYRIIQPKPILVNQAPTFALEVKNVSGKPLKFAECGLIPMRVAGFGMCADPRTSVLPKYTQRGVADMKQSPPIQPDQTVVFDVVYPEPLSKTGRYQVECTVLPPPNNRDVPSDEYCPCPPVVLEVMEAGQTEPPEQDPTQWPDGAWGEAIEKMQIRLDPVQSFLNPGAAAACLMLDARNFGKRDMTLSIPSESIELEFDGVWYHTTDADMGRPPKVYPFGPGNRWQGLQLAPSAQEGWRDSDNKKLANPLGKHTVRLAVTLQPAADGGKPVRLITNAIEFHPADAAPPATEPAAVQPVEQSLPIASKEHPNEGLRLESVPADQAKPGLCAVGPYDKSDMPARPLLYDMAIKGRVANGPNELIGRLHGGDLGTPIKIMKFTRKGHELEILVALSPKKSEGSSYIWGELPRNLPAGRYHVRLTGLEFEERDGQLVPAPKDDIRIFYQLECYFVVGGTPEQDAAWKREGDVVEKAFQQLAERLKFLETDFPRNKLDDQPELFHDETQRTALGEVTSCGIQFQYNWDLGVPRKSPEPGTSGLAVFVDAYRDAPYEDREAFSLINGPVVWDGHTVRREYALDKKEFGWRVHVYVEGNQPEFVKKVNAVIDEDLTQLWKLRAQGALAAPATRHAATQTSVQVADPLAAVVKPFTDDPHPYWAYPDVVSVREIPIDHLAATEIVLKHTQWDLKNEAQSASTDDTIHHPPSPSQAAYYNQIDNYIELWAVRGQVNDAMALKGLLHPTDKPHQWARREIYCLGSENGLSWYGYMPADDFGRFERAHPMHGEPLIPALIRGECKWLLPLEGSAALPDLDRAIADKNPKRKFLVMWMCDSTDPAVTPWLIELTHSRDAEVASGAKEGLVDRPRPQAAELYVRWLSEDIANPSESTMETSLVAACRKIRAAGAAALLPKILAAPRDIWEYREALEFSHELAGQPAMPEALVTAEKTIEEFGNSYADNYDAQKVRQAVEVIAGAHDVDAAAAVGTQLALLHYKGSSESLNNAGIEILRRLPDGAGEKLVQRIAKRDQRDLGELKVILNALGSEPTGGAASQPTTTHADAPVASPEPMIQPAPWQPATDASKKLIKACKSGTAEQVTAAIQAGAEVNAHDDYGQTPVMVAAAHNEHPEVIALLVKSGADVNAMTKDGMTVLMFAARESQNSDVIAALVKAGADVNAKNVAGQTALDIARAVKNSQAEAALLKSGAKEK